MKEKLPVTSKYVLNKILSLADQIPRDSGALSCPVLIRLLRKRLGMTQDQLAKRAGIPQSHVAKIEKGNVDLQIRTLRNIFSALFCDTILIPKPLRSLDLVVEEQAKKAARKKVLRVAGNMSLEKQLPNQTMLENLIKEEAMKLLKRMPSEIWEA